MNSNKLDEWKVKKKGKKKRANTKMSNIEKFVAMRMVAVNLQVSCNSLDHCCVRGGWDTIVGGDNKG